MVRINENYSFDNDGKCLALYRTEMREKKAFGGSRSTTGEIKDFKSVVGYYKNIEQLVLAVADDATARKCNDGTVAHIREYLAEYRKAAKELKDAVCGLNASEDCENAVHGV